MPQYELIFKCHVLILMIPPISYPFSQVHRRPRLLRPRPAAAERVRVHGHDDVPGAQRRRRGRRPRVRGGRALRVGERVLGPRHVGAAAGRRHAAAAAAAAAR